MSRLAVIGTRPAVDGFALAGAMVIEAADAAQARAAWAALPADVAIVVLTPVAAAAVPDPPPRPGAPLRVVMPC